MDPFREPPGGEPRALLRFPHVWRWLLSVVCAPPAAGAVLLTSFCRGVFVMFTGEGAARNLGWTRFVSRQALAAGSSAFSARLALATECRVCPAGGSRRPAHKFLPLRFRDVHR